MQHWHKHWLPCCHWLGTSCCLCQANVNKAASVLKELFMTDADDITCGQKRHTRNSVKLNYLSACNERMLQLGLKRRVTEFTSVVDNAWRWTYLVRSEWFCYPLSKGQKNRSDRTRLWMQVKKRQLLARHFHARLRILHANTLKGVVIWATDFMRAESGWVNPTNTQSINITKRISCYIV